MQELLTGKKRLPGFSGEWGVNTLLELCGSKKELFDDGDWIEAEFVIDEGIRLIQTGNIGIGVFVEKDTKKYISPESFNLLKCKEIHEGDILICRLAEPAGRACILPNIGEAKMITAVDVTIFRPLETLADRKFLISILSTSSWFNIVNEKCGGSTRTRIARSELGKIKIKLPPLREQTAIAQILSEMDAEIDALEKKLAKYRLLKQGMMQELLTGKIRLV
ncbi:MAG: restriction endonuclease subunit M [Candidatus Brocadia sp. WS118]|nr:MAG: restriction endonuclease subunit M [Candidatus Brocadia sp. WS118]